MKEISMDQFAEILEKGTLEGKLGFSGRVSGEIIVQKGIKTRESKGTYYEGQGDFFLTKADNEGKAVYTLSMSGRGKKGRGERINYANMSFGITGKIEVDRDEARLGNGNNIKFRTNLSQNTWLVLYPDDNGIVY